MMHRSAGDSHDDVIRSAETLKGRKVRAIRLGHILTLARAQLVPWTKEMRPLLREMYSLAKRIYFYNPRVFVFFMFLMALSTMIRTPSGRQLQDAQQNGLSYTINGADGGSRLRVTTKPGAMRPSPYDNDNGNIPGSFWNDQLYVLGARLTTSYDKFDESVFFDMFGHATGEGSNAAFELSKHHKMSQLSYKNASQQQLYCQVQMHGHDGAYTDSNDRVLMEFVPTVSLDTNTLNADIIWRCDLSKYLSRTTMAHETHVRVSVYTESKNPYLPKDHQPPIITVDIPVEIQSIGHAGPFLKSAQQPSFLKQISKDGPAGVVLCVSGIDEHALWYLPEFVQHHINVGVDHIVLGMDVMDEILMSQVEHQLQDYMDQGTVVIGASSNVTKSDQVRKLRFYNQCLYHAKGISEFLLIWDVDELWMPPVSSYASLDHNNGPSDSRREMLHSATFHRHHQQEHDEFWKSSHYSQAMTLVEAVRSMRGPEGCTDWCFQTFPTYTIERVEPPRLGESHPLWQGFYGFPVRESQYNYIRQKPVIRTKYAHQASYHIGGSCRRPLHRDRNSMLDRANKQMQQHPDHPYLQAMTEQAGTKYEAWFEDCKMLSERDDSLGTMHHYYKLFRPELGVITDLSHYPDLDEYTKFMRPTTVEQLFHLKQQQI